MRYYDHEGVKYPSVTTILDVVAKPKVEAWRLRVGAEEATKISSETAERGTAVHAAISMWLGKKLVELPAEQLPYLESFVKWHDVARPVNCQSEQLVLSHKFKYAGTCDLICDINGEPWIVDFKTTNRLQPSMGLQLSAYAQAYFEMCGVRARQLVVQLVPDLKRGFRAKEYVEPFSVFLAHKKIFDWQQRFERPVNQWDGGIIT